MNKLEEKGVSAVGIWQSCANFYYIFTSENDSHKFTCTNIFL